MSVWLLDLTDRRARRPAHGGTSRSGYDGTRDGPRGSLLFDRVAAGRKGQNTKAHDGGCREIVDPILHGVLLKIPQIQRDQPGLVPEETEATSETKMQSIDYIRETFQLP